MDLKKFGLLLFSFALSTISPAQDDRMVIKIFNDQSISFEEYYFFEGKLDSLMVMEDIEFPSDEKFFNTLTSAQYEVSDSILSQYISSSYNCQKCSVGWGIQIILSEDDNTRQEKICICSINYSIEVLEELKIKFGEFEWGIILVETFNYLIESLEANRYHEE